MIDHAQIVSRIVSTTLAQGGVSDEQATQIAREYVGVPEARRFGPTFRQGATVAVALVVDERLVFVHVTGDRARVTLDERSKV